MFVRYLGFVLLVWFPERLHAQSAVHSCDAPILDDGYLVQKQITYPHEANLMYGCDNGRKPAVEGWWATITCQNGTWSHKPQCIDEKDCIPPDIPNAKYKKSPKGWYDNNQSIYITCDKEYESKNRDATAICSNGTWTSVPVCEKSIETCGEPPKIPHAVIIHQEYQELFAADSEVQYECEDGYTVEGGGTKDNITCIFGNWTEGSACKRGTRLGTRDGGVTPGSGVPPAGGGLSAVSGSNEKDSSPSFTSVNHCGAYPVVPNGDVVKDDPMFLKYQCNSFYKRVGPDIVRCHSEGSWSQLPICQEAYCVIDLAQYPVDGVKLTGLEYVNEGETKYIQCIWDVSAVVLSASVEDCFIPSVVIMMTITREFARKAQPTNRCSTDNQSQLETSKFLHQKTIPKTLLLFYLDQPELWMYNNMICTLNKVDISIVV
ncbi:complement factor H-related protein 4-like isoform X2 [Etheostoma spectabile]|uniref:complement factor H-related protein 4-like isoform X2 n=1 Tax=Etheostoma spectabile TaxID=54343 RepID=UPI0013AF9DF7|nr:complement factor H-related protein 4-like isoform X2 [Etheostoma spectabile]